MSHYYHLLFSVHITESDHGRTSRIYINRDTVTCPTLFVTDVHHGCASQIFVKHLTQKADLNWRQFESCDEHILMHKALYQLSYSPHLIIFIYFSLLYFSSWLWKDKLHIPSFCKIQLFIKGQVTYSHFLTHPTDYGMTGYISRPPETYIPTSYHNHLVT